MHGHKFPKDKYEIHIVKFRSENSEFQMIRHLPLKKRKETICNSC